MKQQGSRRWSSRYFLTGSLIRSVIASIALVLPIPGLAAADAAKDGSIHVDLKFNIEDPSTSGRCRAVDSCRPWAEELPDYRRELFPVVPVRTVKVLIPPGQEYAGLSVDAGEGAEMDYVPEFSGRNRVISLGYDPRKFLPRYMGGVYPQKVTGEVQLTDLRGFTFVEVPVYPFQVTGPGTARYFNSIKVSVQTRPAASMPRSSLMRPNLARDYELAVRNVDNGVLAPKVWWQIPARDEAPVGYLIIGKQAIIGDESNTALRPLIEEKRARGLNVEMVSLESIAAGGTVASSAQIREFIKQAYVSRSIDFVLLVGDKANLPWQKIRSGINGNGDPVPSDQYYACLDGTFTGSTSSYDWNCEVAVGRVGVSNSSQLAVWVSKHMALVEAAKAGRTTQALSYGEELDSSTLGSWVLEHLVTGRSVAPATVGFPASTVFTKLYDQFRTPVSASTMLKTMEEGDFHVLNHLGHANSDYALRMNASRIPDFKSRPAFFYSQGCYPNNPDVDNWTIQATRFPDFGPAAMISNTRYGWYQPGRGGEGSSAVLHRAFWSQRFKGGIKAIGQMNHFAKAEVLSVDRSSLMVYTALESNLIGDPELDLMIGQ
ncbi:MAG: hypothetical protein RIQ81_1456 [Pseudomonadota bacterium]|jgi:hypothetical protein